MATTSTTVPLAYGFNWMTGFKLQGSTLQNTGNSNLDYTRIGFYLLSEGEQDGLVELWDAGLGRLLFQSEADDATKFHFHRGCDATGTYGGSIGTDQAIDGFWSQLPPGLQQLNYNRWAYYAFSIKQLINNPPSSPHQYDPNVWADVNPVGLWRGMRCRIFSAAGALVGYAFTRNPAWHYVDLLCRRKLFPEYSIDFYKGADDLPVAVKARFDWAAIADTATYFDQVQPSGQPRFTGDYCLSQRTTLQANITQILTCSRSFQRERAGVFSILADQPRASVFTFSRKNADNLIVTDADLHNSANVFVGKFRDLQVPAFATIASIVCPDLQNPTVYTEQPHSAVAGDYIVIGNTGTQYDGNWMVESVPAGTYINSMTLVEKGSNYPAAIGSGGLIGFRYSRFKERVPEFQHHAHELVRGAVGVGIPRQRNKVKLETDFANSTFEQVARVSAYQRGLALGPDVQPYLGPPKLSLSVPLFALDAAGSGAVAIQLEPGDVVTIDDTLSPAYTGEYEVMPVAMTLTGSQPGNGTTRSPVAGGLSLTLRPYDPANYPDLAPNTEPGWPDVPGLPGGTVPGTTIPLLDGGEAVFFTGSGADGDSFQLPSGFSTSNMLSWASPQGYIPGNYHLHFIDDCDAYSDRTLALIYDDGAGSTWRGDLNYCVLAWRTQTSANVFTQSGVSFVELTLAGGEKLLFSKSIQASGVQLPLPAGYAPSRTLALAFPKSATESGQPCYGFGAWINANGILHHLYHDDGSTQWEGRGQSFICSIANNAGSWRKLPSGWWHCPLPDGRSLALLGLTITTAPRDFQADTNMPVLIGNTLPALAGISSQSIQVMTGPNGFDVYNHASHPAHGIKQCFVDQNLVSTCTFEDGSGNQWMGSSGIFALLCDTPTQDLGGAAPQPDGSTWAGTTVGGSGTGGGGTGGGGSPFQPPTSGVGYHIELTT